MTEGQGRAVLAEWLDLAPTGSDVPCTRVRVGAAGRVAEAWPLVSPGVLLFAPAGYR